MIRKSTRVFAWVCIVIVGMSLVLSLLGTDDEGSRLQERVIFALSLAGWVLLLIRPVAGWWVTVLMYVYQAGEYLWELRPDPSLLPVDSPVYQAMLVVMFAVLTSPLLVLALDSPWRWRRVREAEVHAP